MPNLINELVLDDLQERVEASSALLLVDPAGLKSDESLAFRKKLAGAGARMRLAKARLVRRAVGDQAAKLIDAKGSLAIIVGEDIAAATKIVRELAKDEKVRIRGGVIEGRALDARAAERLADMPTKREAQAMVVRAIRAPAVRLARLLKAPTRRLGRALQAHKDKLEG